MFRFLCLAFCLCVCVCVFLGGGRLARYFVFLAFVVLGFASSVLAKRLAGKNV